MRKYEVSEQTGRVIDAIVTVEKAWSEISNVVDDVYESPDTVNESIDRFTDPFCEIERQLGQILVDSITSMLCETKNEWKVI